MTTDTQLAPTDAEIEALGHRMCWRYKHDTGVNHVSTWKFNAQTLHDFARAVLAKWGTPQAEALIRNFVAAIKLDRHDWEDWPEDSRKAFEALRARPELWIDACPHCGKPRNALQPVEREPLTHAQAKALVSKYGNDPLHLVYQVEVAHGIKIGGQHGA